MSLVCCFCTGLILLLYSCQVMEERRGVLGFSSNTPMPTTGSTKALKASGGHVVLPKPPTHTSAARHGVCTHARLG